MLTKGLEKTESGLTISIVEPLYGQNPASGERQLIGFLRIASSTSQILENISGKPENGDSALMVIADGSMGHSSDEIDHLIRVPGYQSLMLLCDSTAPTIRFILKIFEEINV
jgi:hypothetical protein